MTKKRDETILALSQRLRDSVRMLDELPKDAEVIPEVQKCLFFKRVMPRNWQDELAAPGMQYDRLNELIMYFSRIEKNERSRTH